MRHSLYLLSALLLASACQAESRNNAPQLLSQSLPDVAPLLEPTQETGSPELPSRPLKALTPLQAKELEQLQTMADKGARTSAPDAVAARAAWVLGLLYLHGAGVQADAAQAHRWFEFSYNKGEPMASAGLAWCELKGCGHFSDPNEAKKWIRILRKIDAPRANDLTWVSKNQLAPVHAKNGALPNRYLLVLASNAGNVHALIELGMESAAQNRLDQALTYFDRAAARSQIAADNATLIRDRRAQQSAATQMPSPMPVEHSDANTLFKEAQRYHRGEGIPANYNEAIRLYKMAERSGSLEAKRMLALIFARAQPSGQIDMLWMRQLADADVAGKTPHFNSQSSVKLLRREPTPLYDLLPKLWKPATATP
jgi:TPR repeat protein